MYRYEAAFGAADITSRPMRQAIADWFGLYYRNTPQNDADPCQRIACTVVSKLVRSAFGEYRLESTDPVTARVALALDQVREQAMQLAMVGGECYLKPCFQGENLRWQVVSRENVLIFGRDERGEPTDMGMTERSAREGWYYTLLERRWIDPEGLLTVENKLYRSRNMGQLGTQVSLQTHPDYAGLPDIYTFPVPVGLGLQRLCMPMLNCVDGSPEGVAIYAPAVGLIRNLDENEAQLTGEFRRGQSRVFASADILEQGALTSELFVGLDDDPERLGLTVFSPQLREGSYLARKQEYLRNIESVIGLKRGMLSDANVEDRTATEISASAGEFNLTVIGLQQAWTQVVERCIGMYRAMAESCGLETGDGSFSIDWGNGTLYDEDKLWDGYLQMVDKGLLKPEIALGWRFNLPSQTEAEQMAIRQKLMPEA